MTETPRPDPWELFHRSGCDSRYVTIAGYSRRCNCGLDAARAADAARLAELDARCATLEQEVAAKREVIDRAAALAERQEGDIHRLDNRCAILTAALQQVHSAFREAGLEESYQIADDLACAALAGAPWTADFSLTRPIRRGDR